MTCQHQALKKSKSKLTTLLYPSQKKLNRENPRLNQEFRFISNISKDLTEISSKQYFIALTWLNLGKIL